MMYGLTKIIPVVLRKTYNDWLTSTGSRAKNIKWGYHYLRQPIRKNKNIF